MTRKPLTVSLAALALILFAAAPPAAAQSFDEEVREMVDLVVEAWNGGDPGALAEMFTEDADLRDQDGLWLVGREDIHGYFERWMAGSEGAKEVHVDRSRLVTEELAVVDVISGIVPKGGTFWGEETERLAITVQVARQPDGSWLFASWRQCGSAR
jgi:uncharacterized protein (TIGR02246 family)